MEHANVHLHIVNLFCSSLRQRPSWAAAATLLQSKGGRWRETNLGQHDLELSVPQQHTGDCHRFRMVLVSPADIENPDTFDRIERLSDSNGGQNGAAVFLLDGDEIKDGMGSFMRLQMRLLGKSNVPMMPLTSVEALPPFLETFQGSLVASTNARPWPVDAAQDLLPYCIPSRAPLPRPTTQILSQNSLSFRELVDQLTSGNGRDRLYTAIGPEALEHLIAFWTYEYAMH
ncbi:hypothetical protein B0H66DRAFT_20032 [Apodospora peruviana]|uniref:Uncharacterized protein n=1 Tax=Apodospora peruviana TaxID=516989 RepID=A0AAE0IQJ9_9PEZI|nr:hypothetical protein B0H66DRAFT_20032 [Apodospora peruviana]